MITFDLKMVESQDCILVEVVHFSLIFDFVRIFEILIEMGQN